jgi:hypothetical protein
VGISTKKARSIMADVIRKAMRERNSMTSTKGLELALVDLGFEDVSVFRKDDPRGPEYGFYQFVFEQPPTGELSRIQVEKCNPNTSNWVMHFDCLSDFRAWAEECT